MTDPIYIGVDGPVEGANLVRALGYHGLSSGLVRSDARWQIEVTSPRERWAHIPRDSWKGAGGLEWGRPRRRADAATRPIDFRQRPARSCRRTCRRRELDRGGDRKVFALEPLSTMLALASATLLMVLAGVTKNHLVWQPRRVPFRRWRRRS